MSLALSSKNFLEKCAAKGGDADARDTPSISHGLDARLCQSASFPDENMVRVHGWACFQVCTNALLAGSGIGNGAELVPFSPTVGGSFAPLRHHQIGMVDGEVRNSGSAVETQWKIDWPQIATEFHFPSAVAALHLVQDLLVPTVAAKFLDLAADWFGDNQSDQMVEERRIITRSG